jgi:release factor glutamine methyltransferase
MYITGQLSIIYEPAEASGISDWLIEHLTGAKKTDRVIQKEKLITAEQELQLNQYLNRLLQHEPIQYVLNEAWFCGLKFYVDKNVLIPRPETEELVEWIISDCKFPIDKMSVLDIGTGSGCIPISLKKRLNKAEVWSCDVNPEALKIANTNATTLGINIKLVEVDFLSTAQTGILPIFDIIVSNPPYIPLTDKATMHRNVTDHEPAMALFVPDNDALIFYKAIARFAKKHLAENGVIYAEMHENLGEQVSTIFQLQGYKTIIKTDMQGKERMIKAYLINPAVY